MIIAQIATIPERERTLQIATRSLYRQVDFVKVIRNSKSDGKKFSGLGNYKPEDIIIVCDDDIEYPPDFVETLLSYLKPGIVVTVMGKIMKPRPIDNYYKDFETCYRTFSEVEELVQIEVPGTCGLAFHRSTCPDLDDTYFKSINSDVWMAVYCKEKGIPAFVIPHSADWLKNLMPLLPKQTPSVFDRFEFNCQHMTDLINKI